MKMQEAINDMLQRCIGRLRFGLGGSRRSQRLFILVTHKFILLGGVGNCPVLSDVKPVAVKNIQAKKSRPVSHSMNKVARET